MELLCFGIATVSLTKPFQKGWSCQDSNVLFGKVLWGWWAQILLHRSRPPASLAYRQYWWSPPLHFDFLCGRDQQKYRVPNFSQPDILSCNDFIYIHQKRDKEATGTFTYDNGRFSKANGSGSRYYCYLTLEGGIQFGITLDEGPDYANLGVKTCNKQKSGGVRYYEGINPFCGKKGLCCRYKQITDPSGKAPCRNWVGDEEGKGDPTKKYHHCVSVEP